LVNALEAAPRGGHISASVSTTDGACVIAVEDDGPGIVSAARERLLQPFFTTKAQGTGLGLAIVFRRVAEARGTPRLESPVNEGEERNSGVWLPAQAGSGSRKNKFVKWERVCDVPILRGT